MLDLYINILECIYNWIIDIDFVINLCYNIDSLINYMEVNYATCYK